MSLFPQHLLYVTTLTVTLLLTIMMCSDSLMHRVCVSIFILSPWLYFDSYYVLLDIPSMLGKNTLVQNHLLLAIHCVPVMYLSCSVNKQIENFSYLLSKHFNKVSICIITFIHTNRYSFFFFYPQRHCTRWSVSSHQRQQSFTNHYHVKCHNHVWR